MYTEKRFDNTIPYSCQCLRDYLLMRRNRASGHDAHGWVLVVITTHLNPVLVGHDSGNEVAFVHITCKSITFKVVVARTKSQNAIENYYFVKFLDDKLRNSFTYILCFFWWKILTTSIKIHYWANHMRKYYRCMPKTIRAPCSIWPGTWNFFPVDYSNFTCSLNLCALVI